MLELVTFVMIVVIGLYILYHVVRAAVMSGTRAAEDDRHGGPGARPSDDA